MQADVWVERLNKRWTLIGVQWENSIGAGQLTLHSETIY